jgi:hypothetical protein
MSVEKKILYFSNKDKNKLADYVLRSAKEHKLRTIVVGSSQGKSAIELARVLKDQTNVISVTEFTYSDKIRKEMKKRKVTPLEKVDLPIQDDRGMRETLLMFGSGVKAALEVARIAVIHGLTDTNFITVAGGGQGLDTALLVNTDHPEKELITDPKKQMLIKEIISLKQFD